MRVMVKRLGERLGERLVETERSDKKLSEIKIINGQLPCLDEWTSVLMYTFNGIVE